MIMEKVDQMIIKSKSIVEMIIKKDDQRFNDYIITAMII